MNLKYKNKQVNFSGVTLVTQFGVSNLENLLGNIAILSEFLA